MKAIKRLFSLVFVMVMMFIMVGCKKVEFRIGIVQYVSAGALDSAREGIVEALEKGGYV